MICIDGSKGGDMNEKIGFDCLKALIQAKTVKELDEAIRVVNLSYPILRENIHVMCKLKEREDILNFVILFFICLLL